MNQTRTWDLHVHIVEKERETIADLLLRTDTGDTVAGRGAAHRNPQDADMPKVGDELAVSRAMSQLAHKLLDTAAMRIGEAEHRPVQLSH